MYRKRYKRFALAALAAGLMMGAALVGQPIQAWAATTVTSTIPVGTQPYGVAYDATNGDVYVANEGSGTVSVINGSTNTVKSTITVGSGAADVAYDAANGDVYVANSTSGTVSVINGSTNTVTSTIPVGTQPYGVAYDAGNGDVYITNSNSNTVSVIDGSTNTVKSTIPVGTRPYGVAYDTANGDVYVVNSTSGTVSVIDGSTNTVTSTITVGSGATDVAYDAGNGDVYVANSNSGTVSVISGSTNTVTNTITVGSGLFGVAYDAANGDVYVANASLGTVSVIDGSTNTVTSTITVGSFPIDVAYDATNGDVYVANYSSSTVSVINGSTTTVKSTIPVGSGAADVAYDAANGDVYVANSRSGTVSVINGSTNTVKSTIPVGTQPYGVAYDATNGDVYITNSSSNTVSVIDGSTNTVKSTIPVGTRPYGVAYDAGNGDVYVANSNSGTVSVISGSTNTVTNTITVGSGATDVAYDAANGDVYVANANSGTVSVISGSTNTVTNTITVGSGLFGVAYDAANGDVYVANASLGTVSLIDGSTNTVKSTITVGSFPIDVAYDATNGDVYVANYSSGTVSVINGSTNTVTSTIPVGTQPYGVAYDAANGDVYVANEGSNTVSVIVPPATAITNSAVVPGSNVDSTAITATPNTAGDTFAVQVTSSSPSAVGSGASVPSGATTYTSGTNISNVAAGDVVTLYEVNSGSVLAATSFTLTTSDILGATITYGGNGASGTAPTDSNQYMVGSSATVAGQGDLAKTGYTFEGWNTKADGSGTSYASGASLTVPAYNVTLYAQWLPNPAGLGHQNVTQTSWTENWTAVSGASSYDVYLNNKHVGTVTQATYDFKGEQPGMTYSVTIASVNGSGVVSAQSNADMVTTLYNPTGAPTGLVHSNVTQTGWTENWGSVTGSTSYDVYLNNNKVGTVTQAVYDFTGATAGTTYQVQVSSVNGSGQASALSTPDSVTTSVYGPTPPTIITEFFPEPAQVGQAYSGQVRVIGGMMPMHWSITTGTLPPGLTLSNQGVISGTPTRAGSYNFTVKVTDSNDHASSRKLTIAVKGSSTLSIKTATVVPTGQPGQPFEQILTAGGGNPPYKWSIIQGTLPSGLKLNSSTGVMSGINNRKSPEILTVEVMDAKGMTEEKQVVIDSLPKNEREIVWETPGLSAQNVPAVTGSDSGIQTTYMPIWYVMQLLKPLGIESTWDGKHWHMTTTAKADLSNVQAGNGNTGIYLNGTLVQNVDTVATKDPSTGKATTYMPIWYVMQLLKRVGLQSTWNGTTWTVTK
ncbi:putative Ig domain-containing protein [Alicyclobacillus curvatus]|nr:putative Ig domain-containing protein [Alicyclobacillus curvatus]